MCECREGYTCNFCYMEMEKNYDEGLDAPIFNVFPDEEANNPPIG